ncbi:MAG: hypothetical protein AAGA56_29660, partial [Myxococcota bacterium]
SSTAPPEVWHWDPTTGTGSLVALPPPSMGVTTVRASNGRLWWTTAELNPDGPGFLRVELYAAALPLNPAALPIQGTLVAELATGATNAAAASDTQYAYASIANGPGADLMSVVDINGSSLAIPLPVPDDATTDVVHLGHDGQLNNALWLETFSGIYRLQIPETLPTAPPP